jgi:ABC-2 type transport system ATP-binding protein
VDFEVRRGEIYALLGSNGAGKTTTVNILSTLMKADGGEASICGFDVQRQSDQVRRSISLTGQFAALDGMLTGRENLMLIADDPIPGGSGTAGGPNCHPAWRTNYRIATGTLNELKKMFPTAEVEYIEKQPTLEQIFLTIIGKKGEM